MKASYFPIVTRKHGPGGSVSVSHDLMVRSGMIAQQAAGLFTWLPLGQRVLDRIGAVIGAEMELAGAQKVTMPVVQPSSIWVASGRINVYGKEMLSAPDRGGECLVFSPTCEELATNVAAQMVHSYKHLPLTIYQIAPKFRDELRPRGGVMRAREFLMKDAYSFDADPAAAQVSYHRMFAAYQRVFDRIGVSAIPVAAAVGEIGGTASHEFILPVEGGDDRIAYDRSFLDGTLVPDSAVYQSAEVLAAHFEKVCSHKTMFCDGPLSGTFNSAADGTQIAGRGIEVGHVFMLGTKYTDALGFHVRDANNHNVPVHMGSYGIGVSRLAAAVIEHSHDNEGVVWPEAVAPFRVAVLGLAANAACVHAKAERVYAALREQGVDALYDDRAVSAGAKFADAALMGIPFQVRIGKKNACGETVELYDRRTGQSREVDVGQCLGLLAPKTSQCSLKLGTF